MKKKAGPSALPFIFPVLFFPNPESRIPKPESSSFPWTLSPGSREADETVLREIVKWIRPGSHSPLAGEPFDKPFGQRRAVRLSNRLKKARWLCRKTTLSVAGLYYLLTKSHLMGASTADSGLAMTFWYIFSCYLVKITPHPLHSEQVIHRLSVLFTNPQFCIKSNDIE